MQIGVPREILAGESRVAASPKSVEQLIKLGFDVAIESQAGVLASFDNAAYEAAGATIVSSDEVWQSGLILKVNAPHVDEENGIDEIALLQDGATLVSFIWPAQNAELMEQLSSKNINVLAMDSVPRISRAQALDALSSMLTSPVIEQWLKLLMNSVASSLAKLLPLVKYHQLKC